MQGIAKITAILAVALTFGQGAPSHNVPNEIEQAQGFVSMFNGTREGFQRNFVNFKWGDTMNAVLHQEWRLDSSLEAMVTTGATTN